MQLGKVPHVRRIFNIPAEKKFDIRPVSLELDYPNDFTVLARCEFHSAVVEVKRVKTRPTSSSFSSDSSRSSFPDSIKILCLLYVLHNGRATLARGPLKS